jgi:hypothetical protein
MNENLIKLIEVIQTRGPIKTARVSSAQARGFAKKFAYWGVARYQIALGADGQPVNKVVSGASSDRRSLRLVTNDLEDVCSSEVRVKLNRIGHLSDLDAELVLKQLR